MLKVEFLMHAEFDLILQYEMTVGTGLSPQGKFDRKRYKSPHIFQTIQPVVSQRVYMLPQTPWKASCIL